MKVTSTNIWIIIVSMCMFAVLASITLSKGNNSEDKKTSSTAVAAKDMDLKLPMPHGPMKNGLAAFLKCERKQFKVSEPIPVMFGIVCGETEKRMSFQPPYGACQPEDFSWFSITGPDGNDVPYTGRFIHFAPVDPENVIWLAHLRFCGIVWPDIRWGYKLDTPGSYNIKWHYRIPPTSDASWWTGKLISNEVQFEIVDSDVSSKSQTVEIGDQVPSFSGNISTGGPFLHIQLLPQRGAFSNFLYLLEIRGREDVLIQSVSIRNGVPIYKDGFEVVDLNADGYKDIRLLGGKDRAGDRWYKSWLYNPNTKKYSWPEIQPGPR